MLCFVYYIQKKLQIYLRGSFFEFYSTVAAIENKFRFDHFRDPPNCCIYYQQRIMWQEEFHLLMELETLEVSALKQLSASQEMHVVIYPGLVFSWA